MVLWCAFCVPPCPCGRKIFSGVGPVLRCTGLRCELYESVRYNYCMPSLSAAPTMGSEVVRVIGALCSDALGAAVEVGALAITGQSGGECRLSAKAMIGDSLLNRCYHHRSVFACLNVCECHFVAPYLSLVAV